MPSERQLAEIRAKRYLENMKREYENFKEWKVILEAPSPASYPQGTYYPKVSFRLEELFTMFELKMKENREKEYDGK